jgi:UPF0176 protein
MTVSEAIHHIAFYKFVSLENPSEVAAQLRLACAQVLGHILVAHEGINGVLAGTALALQKFEQVIRQDTRFANMAFKRSACITEPFARMKVHVRPEIVSVGLPVQATGLPFGGVTLSPPEWRELMAQPDVVVLDNRNSFEFRLGHFKAAVDPGVNHFRDFPKFVAHHAQAWRDEGKRVAMYCTGGIRCEKLSAWMTHGLGLKVFQLDGGVLNFFQTMPDAQQDWQGECFVFDNRLALSTQLQETATTAEQVYGDDPESWWRLQRAKRLGSG